MSDDKWNWTCPMCGDNYRFSTHPFCLKKALRERDESLDRLRGAVEVIDWCISHGAALDWMPGEVRAKIDAAREQAQLAHSDWEFTQRRLTEARALLRECRAAIVQACGTEDGLDCGEGSPLLARLNDFLIMEQK